MCTSVSMSLLYFIGRYRIGPTTFVVLKGKSRGFLAEFRGIEPLRRRYTIEHIFTKNLHGKVRDWVTRYGIIEIF
jgi:hypothetical protein